MIVEPRKNLMVIIFGIPEKLCSEDYHTLSERTLPKRFTIQDYKRIRHLNSISPPTFFLFHKPGINSDVIILGIPEKHYDGKLSRQRSFQDVFLLHKPTT